MTIINRLYKEDAHKKEDLILECAWQDFMGFSFGSRIYKTPYDESVRDNISIDYSYKAGKCFRPKHVEITKETLIYGLQTYINNLNCQRIAEKIDKNNLQKTHTL